MDEIRNAAQEAIRGWLVEVTMRADYNGIPSDWESDLGGALKESAGLSIIVSGEDETEALVALLRSRKRTLNQFKRAQLDFHAECMEWGRPTPTQLLKRKSAAYVHDFEDLYDASGAKVGISALDIDGFHTPDEARALAAQITAAADKADRVNRGRFTPLPASDRTDEPGSTRRR